MKQIEVLVSNYLTKNLAEAKPVTLHSLLDFIAEENKLEIFKQGDVYCVKCDCGYYVVIDTIFTLMRMEKEGIIVFHTQGNHNKDFADINHIEDCNVTCGCGRISGTAADYITTRCNQYLYCTPEGMAHFKENGFDTPELLEAKNQTKYAGRTMKWAIASFVASVIFWIVEQICKCC